MDKFWVPLIEQFHLWGQRKCAFSIVVPGVETKEDVLDGDFFLSRQKEWQSFLSPENVRKLLGQGFSYSLKEEEEKAQYNQTCNILLYYMLISLHVVLAFLGN